MPGPVEPNLKIGAICEMALMEKDDVMSLIRLVDKFTITITGKEPPDQLPQGTAVLTIVMTWVGGLGSHEAAYNIVSPDGTAQRSPSTWSFNLDSLHGGHSIIATQPVKLTKAGVYWIEFVLNGEVKNRVPFQVLYQRKQLRT